MVSVTSDVAASVPVPSTPSKSAKSQQPKSAGDQFGALVDSNTDAATSTQAPDLAPRRSDAAKSSSDKTNSDKSSRDTTTTDQTSQARSNDQADDAAPADKTAAADSDKGPAKAKDKSETSETKSATKSDESKDTAKSEQADETDGLAAAVQAADAAQQQAASQATPDPTAVIVPVPVAPTDPAATGAQAGTATDSPLTIAAAGIAASASTAAQIAAPATTKTDAATATTDATAKTADTDAAAAKAALADAAAAGTADAAPTDPQASGALVAAVDKATPKTAFKEAVTAQSNRDVSDITGDKDAAKPAGLTAASPNSATTATNAPAHPQAAKPETNGNTAEAKTDATDRSAQATPAAPTPHGHAANAQAQVNAPDPSAQAAAAIQAPATNTVSSASASTATLTATAATSTAVPLSGLPVEIAAAARAGKTQFDIRLDPAELGRIDVRIAVDRNGQVTSHLTVEKPETLSMLRQDAPQLQRALDDAGLKTGSNGLSFSLRDQNASSQNNGNSQDNGGNARRLIVSEDESLPASPVARGYGRLLGSSSGVDIRV